MEKKPKPRKQRSDQAATKQRKQRSDQFIGEYVNLPLIPGTKKRIDAVLLPDETRTSFIRDAIRVELRRRGDVTDDYREVPQKDE